MKQKSIKSAGRGKINKPDKPYKDFPLFPHATKRWAKKILGRTEYFGAWDDPNAALQKYLDTKDDLYASRRPQSTGDGVTVKDLCNHFLTSKQQQADIGEITHRSFLDYKATTDRVVRVFGLSRRVDDLRASDFEQLKSDIAKTRGLVALGNEITRARVVFNYAWHNDLVEKPIKYGSSFKRPSTRVLRKERNSRGPKMFDAVDIRTMLVAASLPMKAMILLGVNIAFGNSDCGTLPFSAVDLDGGWINYPRPKTGVERRCPLWPVTVEVLRRAIDNRPQPKLDDGESVFLTRRGLPWAKQTNANPISREFRKLLDSIDAKAGEINGGRTATKLHRKGLGFYGLRHTFETIGGESRDQVAVVHIMGHADQSMAAHYRERISDERLRAVVNHVHSWLYGGSGDDRIA